MFYVCSTFEILETWLKPFSVREIFGKINSSKECVDVLRVDDSSE